MSLRRLGRPFAQSTTNFLAWIAALWGFEVTADLALLVAAALGMGALNFWFAWGDARLNERQTANIDRMSENLRAILSFHGSRPHERDLREAPASVLRRLALETATRLRAFEGRRRQALLTTPYVVASGPLFDEYRRDLEPDTIAVWNELTRRLGDGGIFVPVVIQSGMLAGPEPASEAARALETLSSRLEGDLECPTNASTAS